MGPTLPPHPTGSRHSLSSSSSGNKDGLLPAIPPSSSSAAAAADADKPARNMAAAKDAAATTTTTTRATATAITATITATATAPLTAKPASPSLKPPSTAPPSTGRSASKTLTAQGEKADHRCPPNTARHRTSAPLTASQKLADILTKLGPSPGQETALTAESKQPYKRFIEGYSAVGHPSPSNPSRPGEKSATRRSFGLGPDATEIFSALFAEADRQELSAAEAAKQENSQNTFRSFPSPLSSRILSDEEMMMRKSRQKAKSPRPETHYDYFAGLGVASGAVCPEELGYRLKSQKKRFVESRTNTQGPCPPPHPYPIPPTPATSRRSGRDTMRSSVSPVSPLVGKPRASQTPAHHSHHGDLLVATNHHTTNNNNALNSSNANFINSLNNSLNNSHNSHGNATSKPGGSTSKSPTRATLRDGAKKGGQKSPGKAYDRFEIASALAKEKADQRMWEACESIRFLVFGTEAKAIPTKDTRTAFERPRGTREEVTQLQRVWSQMDEDNSGDVEFQEFLSYFSRSKTDRLLGMRCVSYLVDKAQGEGSGEREVGCTIEDMMRLIWLKATDDDVAVMMHWFREAEFTQDRVPTPPLLPKKKYLAIMENFPTVDFDINDTVSLQELVENSLVDSATVRGLYNQWSGLAPIPTQTLKQQDFLEMLCPQGYRAHEGVKCCVDRNGQLLSYLENEFFIGWLQAEKAETARIRLGG